MLTPSVPDMWHEGPQRARLVQAGWRCSRLPAWAACATPRPPGLLMCLAPLHPLQLAAPQRNRRSLPDDQRGRPAGNVPAGEGSRLRSHMQSCAHPSRASFSVGWRGRPAAWRPSHTGPGSGASPAKWGFPAHHSSGSQPRDVASVLSPPIRVKFANLLPTLPLPRARFPPAPPAGRLPRPGGIRGGLHPRVAARACCRHEHSLRPLPMSRHPLAPPRDSAGSSAPFVRICLLCVEHCSMALPLLGLVQRTGPVGAARRRRRRVSPFFPPQAQPQIAPTLPEQQAAMICPPDRFVVARRAGRGASWLPPGDPLPTNPPPNTVHSCPCPLHLWLKPNSLVRSTALPVIVQTP